MIETPVKITAETNNQRSIDSGYVRFEREHGATIHVGAISVHFHVAPFTTADPVVTGRSEIEKLALHLDFSGNIPNTPFFFMNTKQIEIGITNGIKVLLDYELSRLLPNSEIIRLVYTIYAEIDSHREYSLQDVNQYKTAVAR